MAVIKVNKTKDYTIMSNKHFKEKKMSLKAKGLLSMMLSLPTDWDYSISGLVAICKENESAIKSTLTELKEFGYLVVTKKMPNETKTGRIEYTYDIYEQPQVKQKAEKQGTENLPVESQEVENQGQLKTKELNTEKLKTKNKELLYIEEFEILWKLYPNKKGKDKAQGYYVKARKEGTTFEQVEQGIENYCAEIKARKTETRYIKNGSTWFNQHCWNDEYQAEHKPSEDNDYYKILEEAGY